MMSKNLIFGALILFITISVSSCINKEIEDLVGVNPYRTLRVAPWSTMAEIKKR